MTAKSVFALIAAVIIVAAAGFQAGARLSRSSADQADAEATVAAETRAGTAAANDNLEQRDFARVTIENVDQLAFEQAYDLLRSAPRPALELWAKRLEQLPASPRKSAAVAAFYKTVVQVDAATAVDLVLQTMRRDTRGDAVAAVQATVAPADYPEIGRMLSKLGVHAEGFYGLLGDWSQCDPESASKFAESHLDQIGNGAIAGLVANWAQIDPSAAKAWLDRLDGAKMDSIVYASFYEGWLVSDRSTAVRDLIAHSPDKRLRPAISNAASALFRASEAEAYAFVASIQDRGAQRAAVRGMTSAFLQQGGENADTLVVAAPRLASWLLDGSTEGAGEQLGDVVSAWSSADAQGVQRWLEPMPIATRDRVLAQVCRAYGFGDAQRSFEAGFSIQDERTREESLRAALKKTRSREGARELIATLNLSAPQIALLERFAAEL